MTSEALALNESVIVRNLGLQSYEPTHALMQSFTQHRGDETVDELWCLQHPKVFTQGQAGKAEHLLSTGDIPVVQTDRGGQVTYHGPGQLVCYLMIDIKRRDMGPRQLVSAIEQAIVDTLAEYEIVAAPKADAPGVYVNDAKIASLGLRIKQGRSFHGLSLNIDMDMMPFSRINPCGYAGMAMSQMRDLLTHLPSIDDIQQHLVDQLVKRLAYTDVKHSDDLPIVNMPDGESAS